MVQSQFVDEWGELPLTRKRDELSALEKILVVVGLLVFFGTVRQILPGGGGDDRTSGSALFQLTSGSIYIASILLLFHRGLPRWIFRLLLLALPLIVLTMLPLASTLWSQAPEATFRRAVGLLLGSCFAIYLVVRLEPKAFFDLLFVAFAIFLVLNVFAVLVPGVGITSGGTYAGAWRGLSGNKNDFGRTVALAAAILPTAALVGLIAWRKTALLFGLGAFAILVLSKSATSLVSAVGAVAGGLLLYVLCGGKFAGFRLRGGIRLVLAVIVIACVVVSVTTLMPLLLEALGRDPTLTGRTSLWEWAIATNHERWLLGSGYRSFWIDSNTRYFFESFAWNKNSDGTFSDSYAGPSHAHSGYVDTWLELGLVGAVAYGVFLISALVALSRCLARGSSAVGYMFAVIIIFIHVYAITARSILQQSEDVWFMFALIYLMAIKETLTVPPTVRATWLRRRQSHHSPPESLATTTASSQLSAF